MSQALFRLFLCLVPLFSVMLPGWAIDGQGSIVSQGVTRSFVYHAPGDSVEQDLPLVLVFHGMGENGQMIKNYSGFDAVSDVNEFLVVYPTATNIGGTTQWNVYVDEVAGHGGIGEFDATDDVIFIDDLIEYFCSTYAIDPRRIYASGFSNGAYMAYALAVERPGIFAAVAPVSGSLWGDEIHLNTYFGLEFEPVGLMHIHGDADAVVPYPNPSHEPFADIWPLSIFAAQSCGSGGFESIPVISGVDQLVYCTGLAPDTHRVELIRLHEGPHQWPDIAGFDAPAAIWLFFSDHSRDPPLFDCAITGIPMHAAPERITLYPNPTTGLVRFSSTVHPRSVLRVRDTAGRIVGEEPIAVPYWDASALPAGLYLLEIIGGNGERQLANFARE